MNLPTKLPTAAEAKIKVSTCEYEKARKQLETIENDILSAISQGRTSISFSGGIKNAVLSKLKSLGYAVTSGSQYSESYTTVSWY